MSTTTPNMNLTNPTSGTTPGPDWATQISGDFDAIDAHDHTSGKGVPITPDGMNINADLPFAGNSATNVKSVNLAQQSAALSDIDSVYDVSGDLYFTDGAGNQIRITQSGSVTGSTGTITGLPSGSASAAFSAGTFTFQSATSTPATMSMGPIKTGAASASPYFVTITASSSMAADYGLTLPADAPAANQVLVSDGSGTFTWTRGLLPLGSVVATFPNLSGAYSTAATTTADSNGFVKCNGQTIADVTSPMNGAVVPNINNSVFIMGNTTAGTSGGAASVTLVTGNLPSHTHGAGSFITGSVPTTTHTHNFAHAHQWGFSTSSLHPDLYVYATLSASKTSISGSDSLLINNITDSLAAGGTSVNIGEMERVGGSSASLYTTGALSAPSGSGSSAVTAAPSATTTVAISGTSGSTGSGTSFSILPTYITAVYLMRVK